MEMRELKRLTNGKWHGILTSLGVPEELLNGKHQPCPECGGTDRFRYVDQKGDGYWVCAQHGSGDGLDLLQMYLHTDLPGIMRKVREVAPGATCRPPRGKDPKARGKIVSTLKRPAVKGSDRQLAKYLETRGIDMGVIGKPELKIVEGLPYFHHGENMGKYYAMLAKVVNRDRELKSCHRTYFGLPEGLPKRKAMTPTDTMTGSAIRLYPARDVVGLGEGIETVLAGKQLVSEGVFSEPWARWAGADLPVWSCISAHGLEHVMLPASIKRVAIFGDNDPGYAGQAAAYSLAQRLVREQREVVVLIPRKGGQDWNDVLIGGA